MSKKLTLDDFKTRSNEIHGDLYDYSFVDYINCSTKVKILCKIHKEFWQTPDSHMQGRGCPKCGRLSTGIMNSKEMSDIYQCTKCMFFKNKNEFHKKRNKHGIRSVCKDCRAIERAERYSLNKEQELEYGKLYKENNPEKRRETSNRSAAKNRAWFRDFLNSIKNVPCFDCNGLFPPCAMDFDHRDPLTKLFNISEAQSKNEQILKEEIKKCDVVCANCHRIRENNRRRDRNANSSKLNKILHPYKDVPCMDCNIQFPPYVMDFDHRDPDDKLFDLSKPRRSDQIVFLAEINKCDIVCANCHRIRTFVKNRNIDVK